jgi:hypothetical protein
MAEIGTPLDTLTEQTYGVKGREPDTTFEFIGSYPTEPISPFERYLLALEDLQPPVSLNYAPTQTVSYTQPDLRRAFPPVTPSGYAEPPVDPMSYYERPTTMATGGGGGFDNLGGGFNRPSTSVGSTSPSMTPSGGTVTATGGGFTYNEGEYDPATGIGVVYSPGPDEQVTSQQTANQTTPPWSSAVVPGGGGGSGAGGGGGYGNISFENLGTPLHPFTEQRYNVIGGNPAEVIDTPLTGPRFETDPVNVTIPVDTKPPVVTTPPTKTETTTPPTETKQPVVSVGVTKPAQRPPAVVEQRPPFQFIEPTFTRPPLTGPSITDRPITVTPFPELTTIPTDTRRAPEALLRYFRDINYDPEEILAAAMRSMGGRMARRSILNELS